MRILSIFLWIVLSLMVFWGALIVFGPAAINYASRLAYGDQVELQDIRVTPGLKVAVKRIKLDLDDTGSRNGFSSVSRGLEIGWSGSFSQPFFDIAIGPTYIKNVGEMEGVNFRITPNNLLNWEAVKINAVTKNLVLNNAFDASAFSIQATYNPNKEVISQIFYNGEDAETHNKNSIKIGTFAGNFNELQLYNSISTQENLGVLKATNIRFEEQSLVATGANARITNNFGQLTINTNIDQLNYLDRSIDTGDLNIEKLSLETVHSLAGDANFFGDNNEVLRTIKVEALTLPDLNLYLPNAHLDFLYGENNLEILGVGDIGPFDLILKNQYQGRISDSKYQFRANLVNLGAGTLVKSSGKLEISSNPVVQLDFEFRSEVQVETSILNCIRILCAPITLDAAYQFDVNGETISGQVDCGSVTCGNSVLRHKIFTNNSNNLFNEVAKTKIINPIPLAIFYNQILSGKKIGNGHEIIFSF